MTTQPHHPMPFHANQERPEERCEPHPDLTNAQKWQLWQNQHRSSNLSESTKKLQVKDLMGHYVITCNQDQTVKEAAELMAKNRIGIIPVEDEHGKLVGLFTDCDFVGHKEDFPQVLADVKVLFGQMFYDQEIEKLFCQAKDKKLREVMNFDPLTISPNASVSEVVNLLSNKQLSGIPVMENGKIVGVVTRQNIINAFLDIVNSL